MRVVLDTNVTVSAAINRAGAPAEIIEAWRAHRFVWNLSEPLVDELSRVLRSQRLRPYLAWSEEEIEDFLQTLGRVTTTIRPTQALDLITVDPPNNQLLEVALEAEAEYIVSGDSHLLELREFRGTAIVSPAQFVVLLRRAES